MYNWISITVRVHPVHLNSTPTVTSLLLLSPQSYNRLPAEDRRLCCSVQGCIPQRPRSLQ